MWAILRFESFKYNLEFKHYSDGGFIRLYTGTFIIHYSKHMAWHDTLQATRKGCTCTQRPGRACSGALRVVHPIKTNTALMPM